MVIVRRNYSKKADPKSKGSTAGEGSETISASSGGIPRAVPTMSIVGEYIERSVSDGPVSKKSSVASSSHAIWYSISMGSNTSGSGICRILSSCMGVRLREPLFAAGAIGSRPPVESVKVVGCSDRDAA